MLVDFINWDDEGDPRGNVQHIAANGITVEEVEEVLNDPASTDDLSRSSSRPIRFGYTSTGKFIAVVYDIESDDPLVVYPVTAYEAPEP
jgi:hypothetical protein